MATLQDYYVKGENPHFLTKEYQDTIALKQYIRSLQNNRKPEKSIYGFTYSMVETMSQLRFHAEDEYKQHSFMINDKREALPISWNKILDVFTGTSSEPPQTLITQIAQQHIDIIEYIIQNARKILKRERKKVHISTAQQLDGQCLRWLIRQPGVTAAQKAGNQQKILSVVREESYNTLENRVLKAFLQECITGCIFYLQQYDTPEFQNSNRLRAVQRLRNLCQNSVVLPIMDRIAHLHGLPVPNYVLLHDPYYNRIWNLYKELVRRLTLFELAWKFRHILFQDYMHLAASIILESHYADTTIYKPEIWINHFLKDGHFIQTRDFSRIIRRGNAIIEFSTAEKSYHQPGNPAVDFYLRNQQRKTVSAYIAYLPELAAQPDIPAELKGNLIFFHDENSWTFDNTSLCPINQIIEPHAEKLITRIIGFLSK